MYQMSVCPPARLISEYKYKCEAMQKRVAEYEQVIETMKAEMARLQEDGVLVRVQAVEEEPVLMARRRYGRHRAPPSKTGLAEHARSSRGSRAQLQAGPQASSSASRSSR